MSAWSHVLTIVREPASEAARPRLPPSSHCAKICCVGRVLRHAHVAPELVSRETCVNTDHPAPAGTETAARRGEVLVGVDSTAREAVATGVGLGLGSSGRTEGRLQASKKHSKSSTVVSTTVRGFDISIGRSLEVR